jgi:CheY-like chemotaxis protein
MDESFLMLRSDDHYISKPMIGDLCMADLLRQRPLTEQDQKLVSTVYRSGEALLTILNDLLDFLKIEAGRMELDPVPFDLVGNAVKFTDSGSVPVSLEACDGPAAGECDCLIVVKDTGVGISEDMRARVFDSFDQGDSSTTKRYGGTGLGLAITGELVHLMNGTILVESKPGEGSAFSVRLPLTLSSHSELLHASLPKSTPAAFSDENQVIEPPANLDDKRRVLLAEDNPTTQSLISILLQQMGLDLVIVDNGQSAIDYLTDKKVDLILMDCQMPVLDGFKTTAQLRAQGVMTPVVALTAYAREEDEGKCLDAGMNGFLSKPFRQSDLKEVLLRWLGADALSLDPVGKSVND